jgi:hypothetical protein
MMNGFFAGRARYGVNNGAGIGQQSFFTRDDVVGIRGDERGARVDLAAGPLDIAHRDRRPKTTRAHSPGIPRNDEAAGRRKLFDSTAAEDVDPYGPAAGRFLYEVIDGERARGDHAPLRGGIDRECSVRSMAAGCFPENS